MSAPAGNAPGAPGQSQGKLKLEVAANGIISIPKTVFEPLTKNESDDSTLTVRRLDGTIELVQKVGPKNPNFVPRQAWPGGKIIVCNKDEALIKFYERKGMPLPDELQQKVDAQRKEQEQERAVGKRIVHLGGKRGGVFSRLGGDAAANKNGVESQNLRPKGGVVRLSGVEGALADGKRPASSGNEASSEKQQTAQRPKGVIKQLSGAEGPVSERRCSGEVDVPPAKKPSIAPVDSGGR